MRRPLQDAPLRGAPPFDAALYAAGESGGDTWYIGYNQEMGLGNHRRLRLPGKRHQFAASINDLVPLG